MVMGPKSLGCFTRFDSESTPYENLHPPPPKNEEKKKEYDTSYTINYKAHVPQIHLCNKRAYKEFIFSNFQPKNRKEKKN